MRCFKVFGPGRIPCRNIPGAVKFINALLRDKQSVDLGDGEQSRNFTEFVNVVDASLRARSEEHFGQERSG